MFSSLFSSVNNSSLCTRRGKKKTKKKNNKLCFIKRSASPCSLCYVRTFSHPKKPQQANVNAYMLVWVNKANISRYLYLAVISLSLILLQFCLLRLIRFCTNKFSHLTSLTCTSQCVLIKYVCQRWSLLSKKKKKKITLFFNQQSYYQ